MEKPDINVEVGDIFSNFKVYFRHSIDQMEEMYIILVYLNSTLFLTLVH